MATRQILSNVYFSKKCENNERITRFNDKHLIFLNVYDPHFGIYHVSLNLV